MTDQEMIERRLTSFGQALAITSSVIVVLSLVAAVNWLRVPPAHDVVPLWPFVLVTATVSVIGSIGVLKRRRWARRLLLVLFWLVSLISAAVTGMWLIGARHLGFSVLRDPPIPELGALAWGYYLSGAMWLVGAVLSLGSLLYLRSGSVRGCFER